MPMIPFWMCLSQFGLYKLFPWSGRLSHQRPPTCNLHCHILQLDAEVFPVKPASYHSLVGKCWLDKYILFSRDTIDNSWFSMQWTFCQTKLQGSKIFIVWEKAKSTWCLSRNAEFVQSRASSSIYNSSLLYHWFGFCLAMSSRKKEKETLLDLHMHTTIHIQHPKFFLGL